MKKQLLIGIYLLLFIPLISWGQATNASFTGLVTNDKNEPVPGATVQIKNESTGFTTGTQSQADGRYFLRQLPLGGPYVVTISSIGFAAVQRKGYYLDQGSTVNIDVAIQEQATALDEVVVTGNAFVDNVTGFGAVTQISSAQIKSLPLEGRNFSNLIRLSPLQGGGASNLAGQRSGSTNITIDGGNFRSPLWAGTSGSGPLQISQEAIREFEVVTNAYDVTTGRQGGGSVNAVTKSGTNTLTGTAFGYARADQLSSNYDIRGVERTQNFSTYQWGFSLGGPIIKDKLHFFAALDRQDESQPIIIGDIRSEADERRYGIRKDTLNKAISISRELYGVSDQTQVGQFGRKTTANTFFLRLDWTLNDKHRLTFRNNITTWDNPINADDNSNIVLRETYNTQIARSYTGLVSLRSALSSKLTNELKLQYQHEYTAQEPSDQLPSLNIPRAIVNVTSPFPTEANPSATTTRTFQLGGQRFTPEKTKYNQFHLINTSYLTSGKVDLTFGTDTYLTFLEDVFTSELNGRFFFNSLRDFELKKPSRYVREVYLPGGEPWVKYNVLDLSLFAQADFDLTRNVKMFAGVRWDGTAFLTGADYNPLAEQQLGVKTDSKPVDLDNIQPRLQLTWNIGGKDTDILKVGGGAFSSMAMYYNQANNMLFDGLKVASIDVRTDVPTPDFESYRNDPSTAPGVPAGVSYVSTINTVNEDFEVPMNWKANLSYHRIWLQGQLRTGINVVGTRTVDNYVYQERNLVDDPYFRLSNEDNRGVFVPAEKINANGTLNWQDSRKSAELGRVLELTSDGILKQYAVILDAEYRVGADGYIAVAYTYNQTKDNSSYNCCVANTSTFLPVVDDPRALNEGFSDSHFTSKLTASGKTPTWKGFSLGVTAIGEAGTRFSFHAYRAGTSLNGDFNEQNDLAFLFDPNDPTVSPQMAEAINTWFNNPDVPDYAKDYYRDNMGKIAPRNGGINPFSATIDARLTKRFKTFKTQAIELSFDIFNFSNLLNKDWGRNQNLGREQRLLNIRGFNTTSRQYDYSLNSNTSADPVGGIPWRIQIGARYSF
jgi:hypothetical protein